MALENIVLSKKQASHKVTNVMLYDFAHMRYID